MFSLLERGAETEAEALGRLRLEDARRQLPRAPRPQPPARRQRARRRLQPREEGARGHDTSLFRRLVLGWIEADFRVQGRIF